MTLVIFQATTACWPVRHLDQESVNMCKRSFPPACSEGAGCQEAGPATDLLLGRIVCTQLRLSKASTEV